MTDQWDQYVEQPSASGADKWEQYVEKPAPASPAADKSAPNPGFLDTLGREVSSAGSSIAGIPGSIYHAFADEPTPEEQQEFHGDTKGAKRFGLGVGRLTAEPLLTAGRWYRDAAKGKIPNAYEQALSVAPEAIGQGAGTAIGGKLIETAPAAARGIPSAISDLPEISPALKAKGLALGKVAAKEAISRIPVAGRMVERPSFGDWLDAARAKPTVSPEVSQAAPLGKGGQTFRDPAAGLGWVRGQVPVDGEYMPPEPDEPAGPAYAPAEAVTPPRQLEGLPNRPQLPERGSPIALANEYPGVNSPPGPRQPTEPIIRTTRSSPLRILGTRLLDWAGVADETESQALQDAIDHGEPLGKPLRGTPAGRVTGEELPTDPKFTEDGEKLAVEFPKLKSETALKRTLGDQLGKATGAPEPPPPVRPGVKIRLQDRTSEIPEGHTPLDSSWLRSYKYDPTSREFEYTTKEGQHYVRADVDPEAAAKFEKAAQDSPGTAFDQLRKSPGGGVRAFKVINGKRVPIKPIEFRSASPDDLTPEWGDELERVKKGKTK